MSTLSASQSVPQRSYWIASLLVSGACIGGGMLALPVQTAEAGFWISFATLALCWVFMTFTGLLLVEASLWLKNNTHFSSLTMHFLGKWGKALSLIVYLFMNYASLVAYTAGGAALIQDWMREWFGLALSYSGACTAFTLIFGGIIYLGSIFIGKMNALLMGAMVFIYCSIVGQSMQSVDFTNLTLRGHLSQGIGAIPITLAAFSYQMIVPSVASYLNYNVKSLKKAILIGTSIPFLVYSLWLFVIHGVVPFEGVNGLQEAFVKGASSTTPLKAHLQNSYLKILSDSFAFFALVTSYLSLSLALFDFIGDLFKSSFQSKEALSRNAITLLSILPCLVLAILFPRALLAFLDLSGGLGDALLSGLIPIAMIWVGRYRRKMENEYRVPGGKIALVLAGSFALYVFIQQWVSLLS